MNRGLEAAAADTWRRIQPSLRSLSPLWEQKGTKSQQGIKHDKKGWKASGLSEFQDILRLLVWHNSSLTLTQQFNCEKFAFCLHYTEQYHLRSTSNERQYQPVQTTHPIILRRHYVTHSQCTWGSDWNLWAVGTQKRLPRQAPAGRW